MSIVFRSAALVTLALLGNCQMSDSEQTSGRESFVVLIPGNSVQTEVRYFSSETFVGEVIDGYQAPVIYLTLEAYEALRAGLVEAETLGLGIKVFDAYRPQQAVDHFVRWAEDLSDTRMKAQYYPEVEKQHLFRD